MPYSVGSTITMPDEYMLSYTKKNETVTVSAPNKDDAKALFEWLAVRVGLLTAPP